MNSHIFCFLVLYLLWNLNFWYIAILKELPLSNFDLEMNIIFGFIIPITFILFFYLRTLMLREYFSEIIYIISRLVKTIFRNIN